MLVFQELLENEFDGMLSTSQTQISKVLAELSSVDDRLAFTGFLPTSFFHFARMTRCLENLENLRMLTRN